MSLNTKEFEKSFKKITDSFEIEFLLCTGNTKEEVTTHSYCANQENMDAILMLCEALCQLVKKSYCQEDSDVFYTSLKKSISRLHSIHTKEQLLKNQLGGEA